MTLQIEFLKEQLAKAELGSSSEEDSYEDSDEEYSDDDDDDENYYYRYSEDNDDKEDVIAFFLKHFKSYKIIICSSTSTAYPILILLYF